MSKVDVEEFRLRRFVDQLRGMNEVEVHEQPIDLIDLSAAIEATGKATLFNAVGPERHQVVAAVSGSRRRIAAAFQSDERNLAVEVMSRLGKPQPVVEVESKDAPVHAVVHTGDQIDLTRLPFHLQHEEDGGLYISSALDFAVDPVSGKRNVGCRRLMLLGRREVTTNLTNTSDLQKMLKSAIERGEKLPVSFAIGVHPIDFCAAQLQVPVDEFELMGSLRQSSLPMVRGITNGVLTPADAEITLEGFLGEGGYREMDGPYGEFWGLYGGMHIDPVLHVTAVTMRTDALHQTVLHGNAHMSRSETSQMTAVIAEIIARRLLRGAGIEPAAVHAVPSAPIFQQIRVALRRTDADKAKTAINALFQGPGMKHIVVVDDDIDVFSDQEMAWAMATRFHAGRDLILAHNLRGFYEDPTADDQGQLSKMGFDVTAAANTEARLKGRRPRPPRLDGAARFNSVRDALASGPKNFLQLMSALGTRDGRELVLALGELRQGNELARTPDGQYELKGPA